MKELRLSLKREWFEMTKAAIKTAIKETGDVAKAVAPKKRGRKSKS